MGVIGDAVSFHIGVFAGGRTVKVQPLHTGIVGAVQHLLHRDHAEPAGAFQLAAKYASGTVKATVTAHPKQLLSCGNIAKGLLQNNDGTRFRTGYLIVAGLLRLFLIACSIS